jgi:hypothetical protein
MCVKYFTDEIFRCKEIKSIKWISEIFNTELVDPKIIVEKLNGTKDVVDRVEEIVKYLNKTFIEI